MMYVMQSDTACTCVHSPLEHTIYYIPINDNKKFRAYCSKNLYFCDYFLGNYRYFSPLRTAQNGGVVVVCPLDVHALLVMIKIDLNATSIFSVLVTIV